MFLIDTVTLSELRKRKRDPIVVKWFERRRTTDLFLSVISISEIERGIARQRATDPGFAGALADWLDRVRACCLYAYRLPAGAFRPHEVGGYWVAEESVEAVERVVVDDLLGRHARAAIGRIAVELSYRGRAPRPLLVSDRDRKSTRLNSSHITRSRMPSSA